MYNIKATPIFNYKDGNITIGERRLLPQYGTFKTPEEATAAARLINAERYPQIGRDGVIITFSDIEAVEPA